jgi:PAS domain S-box-containing protein
MERYRFNSLRFVNFAVILAGLLMMAVVSWQLWNSVTDLQGAPIDNVQWNLSQLEVDYLKMREAGLKVQRDGLSALPEFRKRYDIFFSRVNLVDVSAATADIHTDPHLHHLHEQLLQFLKETVDIVDSSDAKLASAMPEIFDREQMIAQATRGLAMGGIEISSAISDDKRVEISRHLFLIAVAAPVTFVALFLALVSQQSQTTELNRRSLEIEGANRRFTSTLRASLDAIVVVNEKGLVTDFNGSAEQVFGYKRNQIVGKPLVETLIPHEFREMHSTKFLSYVSGQNSSIVDGGRLQLSALHADGHVFPIETSISEIAGENGPNFVSYMRDITQQLENEKELQSARDDALEAFREKSKFFAMMSHEMRTPLNGIMSALDLLKDGKLDPSQSRFVRIAETSSRILLGHVDDVLTIERLDAGDREILPEAFNVQDEVATLIDALRPLASDRNNELVTAHQGPIAAVVGDLRGLQQILTNLMSNAIKFTSSGSVTVRTATALGDDGAVTLRVAVEDTGSGISEENRSRIFEDFVTVESPYERTAAGTGLGLGIVRRLVQGMGGTLTCESEPGKGSTFTVEAVLQRAEDSDVHLQANDTEIHTAPGTALNVLLVEDNAINRELLVAMIEREGHKITTASNGFEGVHKASESHFDLILMDISMPNMNGIVATQTIRASKSLNAHSPIYSITAHAMPKEIEEFHQAGMDGCLIKPIQAAKLRDILAAASATQERSKKPQTALPNFGRGDPQLLDQTQINEMISVLGEEKAANMFEVFRADSQTILTEIAASVDKRDIDQLQKHAHQFSGSCGTFGAVGLKDALHQIETACKQGNLDDAVDMATHLDRLWQDTCDSFAERSA